MADDTTAAETAPEQSEGGEELFIGDEELVVPGPVLVLDSVEATNDQEGVVVNEDESKSPTHADAAAPFAGATRFKSMAVRSGVRFEDHFTLDAPSSTVRFRNRDVKVYGQRSSQMLLEDNGRGEIVARRASDGSFGVSAVRFCYCLVAVLMAGFLFIFCTQLFLLIFLSLSIDAGLTSNQDLNFGQFLGTLLSLPLWVYGLASAMAIAASFITDTWNGNTFLRSFISWKNVTASWVTFFVFLGMPLLVMIFSLFAGSDSWWEITALTWFSFVFAFYCCFCAAAIYFEIRGCFELMRHNKIFKDDEGNDFLCLLRCTILNRQVHTYSGEKRIQYTVRASDETANFSESADHESDRETSGMYSKLTVTKPMIKSGLFAKMEEPVRLHSIDEVRDAAPYITANTWDLEKLYFRDHKQRYVAVVNGKYAMTNSQVRSSFVCAILGILIAILTVAALLSWLDAPAVTVGLAVAVLFLCTFPNMRQLYASYRLYKDITSREEKDERRSNECDAVYQVWETVRISRASNRLCWVMLALEVGFLYIYPLVSLFLVGNTPIALLFLFTGFLTGVRIYCNPAIVIRELGPLDTYLDDDNDRGLRGHWRDQHRMDMILGKITQGRRRNLWIYCFGIIVMLFCVIFLGAYTFGSSDGKEEVNETLNDFYYEPKGDVPYPACFMGRGMSIPDHPETALTDFTYLSASAYSSPAVTQSWLDLWFGVGVAVDRQDIVDEFRSGLSPEEKESAVTYKLYEFPSLSEPFQVVSIRGTTNGWDTLSDAQLWSAAWIAQQVRAIIPYGEMWNPILENLILAVSFLQTESLKKVSFYKQTTEFVTWLDTTKGYNNIQVTGHSLGGGLAMITGSQTGRPAIALSGPNNKISRLTFDPPLTVDELDSYTFNIVPGRDPVPRIDDLAQNFQRINCEAPANNPVDCHTATRSLCEVLFTCGSLGRPTFCFCTRKFGYPEPLPSGVRAFIDACPMPEELN